MPWSILYKKNTLPFFYSFLMAIDQVNIDWFMMEGSSIKNWKGCKQSNIYSSLKYQKQHLKYFEIDIHQYIFVNRGITLYLSFLNEMLTYAFNDIYQMQIKYWISNMSRHLACINIFYRFETSNILLKVTCLTFDCF